MSPPTSEQMAQRGSIRIGISGWTYKPWRGVFYPAGLPHARELAFSARQFESIEINGTFYSMQRPESFGRWFDATPDDFIFAIKGPRYITHLLRLKNIDTPLANFMASGILRLGHKLGPILWQFPARMVFDPDLFRAFLSKLPRDTEQARRLAGLHDSRLIGRSWTSIDVCRPLRHAIEIRHESFCSPAFIDLLREFHTALVVADTVEWPLLMDVTSDFMYCRLHGSEVLYVSGYDDPSLDRWAARVKAWAKGGEPADALRVLGPSPRHAGGRDVFVYFDNDAKVRAPFDAAGLIRRVGRPGAHIPPEAPDAEPA